MVVCDSLNGGHTLLMLLEALGGLFRQLRMTISLGVVFARELLDGTVYF
jgi:hypothetical protein